LAPKASSNCPQKPRTSPPAPSRVSGPGRYGTGNRGSGCDGTKPPAGCLILIRVHSWLNSARPPSAPFRQQLSAGFVFIRVHSWLISPPCSPTLTRKTNRRW
jgi:hypothetical protein